MTTKPSTGTPDMTVIDAKMPLTWLLMTAGTVIFSFGSLYMKIDTQGIALKEVSAKLEKRDDSMTVVLTTLTEVKTNNNAQDAAIARNAADIADLKRLLNK